MFKLLKKLWNVLQGGSGTPRSEAPPDILGGLHENHPQIAEQLETLTHYVLPLQWSLHYALTKKQWNGVRDRYKIRFPDWDHCSCPKHCKANTLDEIWRYDKAMHTKVFLDAQYICPGCHWLKSPTWRIETWLRSKKGLLGEPIKTPHIIDCLGWTQQRVDDLRNKDLLSHQEDLRNLGHLQHLVKQGQAAMVPTPVHRLSQKELSKLVKPGQIRIVPWRIDLTALGKLGYTFEEIMEFEQRMYQIAKKRMTSSNAQPTAK